MERKYLPHVLRLTSHVSFILLSLISYSQPLFLKHTDVPVIEDSNIFQFPWTGGFNNPQFSAADINNDGILDLVVFDRNGDKPVTFLNGGTVGQVDYEYAPEFEYAFDKATQWMLMEDLDCDGVPDYFSFSIGAADFYKGRYTIDNRIEFDSITFLGYPSHIATLPPVNIYTASTDISAFVDVNNDGDLDVLAFAIFGTTVSYYENQSMELTGTCGDTIIFEEYEFMWGKFFEGGNAKITLDTTCGVFKTGGNIRGSRDGAHSLLAFDEDGDGDKELILGNFSTENLDMLLNCGTHDSACMCYNDNGFPSYDVKYKDPIFPAAYYLDINNDGLRDLLVSPNAVRKSENFECVWLYENVGTQDSVRFQFVEKDFIVNQTIDLGEGANPAFFDYNSDGLQDLVVGNYGYYVNGTEYLSGLALFENTGDSLTPSFRLVDRDWENLSAIARENYCPAFGDMDADGDIDMIVGEKVGFLHYFENTAGAGNTADFSLEVIQMFNIDVGNFCAPFIFDVNEDSLPDLIVGKQDGKLNYFENVGTADSFAFTTNPTNDYFGKVSAVKPNSTFITGFSTPVISPLDSTGKLYLLTGSEEGKTKVYDFNRDSIYSGSFRKKYNDYSAIDEGERTSLTMADLNGDSKLEMVVGNYRGGLAFYTQSDSILVPVYTDEVTLPKPVKVTVYPNPASGEIFLDLAAFNLLQQHGIVVEIYDVLGRKTRTEILEPKPLQHMTLPDIARGVYFIKVFTTTQTAVSKIVIE